MDIRKQVPLFLILFFPISFLFGQETKKDRPTVGVVLSGGGAKGFSHIGALKVLEEAGIPIDYIAGTSMGAIVGGLYAIGYDAHTIDSLVKEQNWRHLLSDDVNRENLPSSLKENRGGYILSLPYELKIKEGKGKVHLPPGMISGQNLYGLFQNLTIGYQDTMDFNHFPIPFACVAADSRSGKEVVLREGTLSEAMRASMAIPGMFSPVEKDSMLLIDGGIINNFPVDVVREMGADIVIGIIFPPDYKSIEKNRGTVIEVIDQLGLFIGEEKRKMNIADTDILITPDLHPYKMMDFENSAIDSIIQRGEQAAREKWEELTALKETLAITDSVDIREKIENPYITMDSLEIRNIRFEGLERIEEADMKKRLDLKNNKITRKDLETFTSRIFASGLFTKVFYRLDGESPFDLIFTVQEKDFNTLDLGIRFDTNDMAAILAHTPIRINSSQDSRLDASIRLSRNPYLILNYSINSGVFYKGGISGKISRNEVKIYNRGESMYNLDFLRNSLNFNFSEFYLHNMKLHVGAEIDHFYFMSKLRVNPEEEQNVDFKLRNNVYVNYFFNGTYDNLNKSNFPTSGQYFSFKYALHTDNFYQMNGKAPLNIFDMRFLKPIRLSDKLYITPELSARSIFNANDSIPLMYDNIAGGQYNGHYVPQQIALQGTRGMELLKTTVGVAQTNVRYHFTPTRGIYANLNFTMHHDELLKLLAGQSFLGGSIGYFYNSIIGPITFELGYSSLSRFLYPFISAGYYF